MPGYGCGVSMYSRLFVKDLKINQMLPHSYIRSFDGGTADKVLKQKWVLDLEIEQTHFSLNVLNQGYRVMVQRENI